jgi:hypothetical protein
MNAVGEPGQTELALKKKRRSKALRRGFISVGSVCFSRKSPAQPAAMIAADRIEQLGNSLACCGFYRVAQLGKGVAPPRTHGVGLLQIRLSVLTVFFVGLKAAVP